MKELKEQYKDDLELTTQILQQTDLASHLFGSPWVASKFQVRDLTVIPEYWFGQYQERDGVSIDRDTETAADGKLYDFQVVPAGTQFEFRAVVENAEEWELGLLMIGLHQFETEQIPLGGGRSRGLGVVKLDIDEMWWFDYPENKPEELLDYLQRLVQGDKNHYLCNQKQLQSHKHNWTQSLITYLTENITKNSTTTTKIQS
jgi:CRISPR/Cas system CSM-associated protein Csm3 (group 7 of RAMP superfamily)